MTSVITQLVSSLQDLISATDSAESFVIDFFFLEESVLLTVYKFKLGYLTHHELLRTGTDSHFYYIFPKYLPVHLKVWGTLLHT